MSASPPSNPLPGSLDGLHHKVNKLFLKKNKKSHRNIFGDFFVIRMRLERMTVCLEGRCSIQLSYRTILFCSAKLDICTGLRKFC